MSDNRQGQDKNRQNQQKQNQTPNRQQNPADRSNQGGGNRDLNKNQKDQKDKTGW